ncbi:hypothetical protein I0Q91_10440 [Halanaerobiaceae bacterium Z-7014]|uniref:Uncharacterized protein n=1 Tax=Halonatronomonas betaini TaxID=2778430 RepID=A0A931F892_9FIRM|nr:hypothetical protein [Halonatronomonas betaini]MBF8437501.1 hypothetical protein [Halonatronomonas betaini]
MKNKNIKFYIGLILVVFLTIGLTGCENGSSNIIGDDYSVTVNIEEIESEEHIDVFSVVADNSSRTTFEEDNFDEVNNSLTAELTNLQGSVDIELIVDNDEIEGSYQLARDTITVTGRDNIIFVVEWQQSGDDEDNDGHEGDDEDEGDNDLDSNQYLLTGNFAQSGAEGQVAAQSDVEAVAQVVLIYSRDYEIHDVEEDGTFEIAMERGEPGGMAFVDEDGNFIGHLKLDEGLDSIPSQSLDDETRLVDLGEIDEDGEPENDPIGNEYDISENDLASMAVADTFFSAVAMNADFVERMTQEGEKLRIYNTYFINHSWLDENNEIDPENIEKVIEAHRMGFGIEHGHFNNPSDMKLSYPNGEINGPIVIPEEWNEGDEYSYTSIHFPGVSDVERARYEGEPIPQPGEYRMFDDILFDISFQLPDITTAAVENLVVPVPQVEVNEEGIVQSMSWDFYSVSGNIINNPETIILDGSIGFSMQPRFDGEGNIIGSYDNILDIDDMKTSESYYNDGRFYEEYHMNINEKIDLSHKEIYWQDVEVFDINYYDRYGINYMVPFINSNYNPLNKAGHVFITGDNYVESENKVFTAQYTVSMDHEVEAPVTLKLEGFADEDIKEISQGDISDFINGGMKITTDDKGEVLIDITFAADVNEEGSIIANIDETDDNIGSFDEDELEINVDTTGNDGN